jgi:hypothetical protein
MPNAKLKCCNCKDRFKRESMTNLPAGNFCGQDCIVEYATNKGKKAVKDKAKKDHALRKRVFYANDIKTRKAAAKKACHDYIRLRDKGNPCICCGRPLGYKFDAGHYLESGNNPKIRYDENNIHAQSVYCNQYQGGNSDDYRGRLIAKIGVDEVERLESMKGGTVKRTAQDYKDIEDYYKDKLKQLNSV